MPMENSPTRLDGSLDLSLIPTLWRKQSKQLYLIYQELNKIADNKTYESMERHDRLRSDNLFQSF